MSRYAVLGLAHPRAPWFSEVARWATAGSAPIDFVKCVSAEEVHARLASGRRVSALLADADRVANDRDLVDHARRVGCAVIVVDDGRVPRDWRALGVSETLPAPFGRDDLMGALRNHAAPVGRVDSFDVLGAPTDATTISTTPRRGRLVAVTGPGGTGASTVAMALAQGLTAEPGHTRLVLLADFALRADLAMLHDARDVVPGLQELVEACRGGTPADGLDELVHHVADRRYDLLLGLRRHRDWTVIRPRAFDVALDTLRRRYRTVVADIDADVEGERETGSVDVAERNHIARATAESADLVVVVGAASLKGLHSLTRTLHDLRDAGVHPERLLPVVNRCGRSPRLRAELTRALADLGALEGARVAAPLFLQERRRLDDGLVQAAPMPAALVDAITLPVRDLLARTAPPPVGARAVEPVAITPGSLGHWHDDDPDGVLDEPGDAA